MGVDGATPSADAADIAISREPGVTQMYQLLVARALRDSSALFSAACTHSVCVRPSKEIVHGFITASLAGTSIAIGSVAWREALRTFRLSPYFRWPRTQSQLVVVPAALVRRVLPYWLSMECWNGTCDTGTFIASFSLSGLCVGHCSDTVRCGTKP